MIFVKREIFLAIARNSAYLCKVEKFGPYLRSLRKQKALTLKQVEKAARVSNSFLSQVERGLRRPPRPDILNRLAAVYDVPVQELFYVAGYIKGNRGQESRKERIERAYHKVLADSTYQQGTRMKGASLSLEAKQFIVEMYEKFTGRKLLEEESF